MFTKLQNKSLKAKNSNCIFAARAIYVDLRVMSVCTNAPQMCAAVFFSSTFRMNFSVFITNL